MTKAVHANFIFNLDTKPFGVVMVNLYHNDTYSF